MGVLMGLRFARVLGQQTDEAFHVKLKGQLEAKLAGYEALLSRHKYLSGNVSSRSGSQFSPLPCSPRACRR